MHHHQWAQDRAKTPRRAGEELLEPMVCQDCGATGHQYGAGTVTGIEMKLSPGGPGNTGKDQEGRRET